MNEKRYLVQPGREVRLADFDPDDTGKYANKRDAERDFEINCDGLDRLQEMFYADGRFALLVVLQGMDTGGKDGVIEHAFQSMNPQGVTVSSFKVPTAEELAHDFLWRIHLRVPRKGMIGIFNRSHYEDVLVVRVHNLVPPEQWRKRYEQINQFEKNLTENGTTILKFYLHISRAEQKQRLEERLADPTKRWKFAAGDLKERERWDDYMAAYDDALNLTSTPWAPWYVVPADRKWYRNLVVSRVILQTLEGLDLQYPQPTEDLSNLVIPD